MSQLPTRVPSEIQLLNKAKNLLNGERAKFEKDIPAMSRPAPDQIIMSQAARTLMRASQQISGDEYAGFNGIVFALGVEAGMQQIDFEEAIAAIVAGFRSAYEAAAAANANMLAAEGEGEAKN